VQLTGVFDHASDEKPPGALLHDRHRRHGDKFMGFTLTIKIQGGKVEITGQSIEVEGGELEIIRRVP
jgi:hypothetical protein